VNQLSLKQKWKLVFKISVLNILGTPIIFLIFGLIVGFDDILKDLKNYTRHRLDFFLPINQFLTFFRSSALVPAGLEEVEYRLLPWLFLILVEPVIQIWKSKYKTRSNFFIIRLLIELSCLLIIWVPFIIGNYFWTLTHSSKFNLILPIVFFTGLTWSWLIIKTKDWQLAVVAHILANISIYFFIKIFLLFGYKI